MNEENWYWVIQDVQSNGTDITSMGLSQKAIDENGVFQDRSVKAIYRGNKPQILALAFLRDHESKPNEIVEILSHMEKLR